MNKTSAEAKYDVNCDADDGVVANEPLVIDPIVPSDGGLEVIVEKGVKKIGEEGDEEPIEVVVKDTGPPDGGYGWVVVAY